MLSRAGYIFFEAQIDARTIGSLGSALQPCSPEAAPCREAPPPRGGPAGTRRGQSCSQGGSIVQMSRDAGRGLAPSPGPLSRAPGLQRGRQKQVAQEGPPSL